MGQAALWAGVAAAAALALPHAGSAADAGAGPVAKFTAMASTDLFVCGSKFEIFVMGSHQALQEALDCTKSAKSEIEPYYAAAKAKFPRNLQMLLLINDFYAIWLAGMNDLPPYVGEGQKGYAIRLEAITAELRQRSQRLKLEE